jgi:2-polyprenyl-3-methyl-5-hydroxy-6-metoxy-1,4-benzoquinol methylase
MTSLTALLRCLNCGQSLTEAEARLICSSCGREYPVERGTVRMLPDSLAAEQVKVQTGESFAYEWEHFGADRAEWEKNFNDYMQPLRPEDFEGMVLLDVGCGSGRHSRQAAAAGARVVAADLGASIDVARGNLPPEVMTVQADAEHLPFARESFDMVMSIGVLHHLPDPERALRAIVPFARPGGRVHVYLYWQPPIAWHRSVLRGVTAVRRVTVRLPHHVLHALCYPLAAVLFGAIVLPYRFLRRRPRLHKLAEALPLKTYADYPFTVCVNDQFDRFSAPLEARYTRDEVRDMLERAGLEDVQVLANHGWVGDGRRPG